MKTRLLLIFVGTNMYCLRSARFDPGEWKHFFPFTAAADAALMPMVRVEMTPYCFAPIQFIPSIVRRISFCESVRAGCCVRNLFEWAAVGTAVVANNRTTSDRPPGNMGNMNIMHYSYYYFGSGLEVILRCCYYINWTWYFYLIINMRFNPIIFYVLGLIFLFVYYLSMVIAFTLKYCFGFMFPFVRMLDVLLVSTFLLSSVAMAMHTKKGSKSFARNKNGSRRSTEIESNKRKWNWYSRQTRSLYVFRNDCWLACIHWCSMYTRIAPIDMSQMCRWQ